MSESEDLGPGGGNVIYDRKIVRNPRGALPVEGDDDSDNESIAISINDDENMGFMDSASQDVQFEDELGYSVVVALRGRTTGRRLKRDICALGTCQLVTAIALCAIGDNEARSEYISTFFENSKHGKDLLALMWLIFTCGFILAFTSLFLLRYWSSFVTNRVLLSTIIKLYVAALFVKFIFTLAAFIVAIQVSLEELYNRRVFISILLASYVIWSGALDSSGLLSS